MKHFAFLAALLLLVGAGCNAATNVDVDTSADSAIEAHMEDDAMMEDTNTDDAMMEEDGEAMTEEEGDAMMEMAGTMQIQSGSSSYIVQKEFFSKPTEEITGTTDDVSGTVTLAEDKSTVSVDATIENTFSTGSGMRDGEVKDLLAGPITVQANSIALEDPAGLEVGSSLSQTMNLDLTIAGTTKTVPFSVTIVPSDADMKVTGSATFNMEEDFGLEPPSALNIYTVAPELTVQFTANVSK